MENIATMSFAQTLNNLTSEIIRLQQREDDWQNRVSELEFTNEKLRKQIKKTKKSRKDKHIDQLEDESIMQGTRNVQLSEAIKNIEGVVSKMKTGTTKVQLIDIINSIANPLKAKSYSRKFIDDLNETTI